MVTKQEKEVKKDDNNLIDEVMKNIDLQSLSNAVSQPDILPSLKIATNEVKSMEVLGNFRFFKGKFGNTFCFDVNYEGMKHNLIIPDSLKFQLISGMLKKGLSFTAPDGITKPDFSKLIGHRIIVKASIGKTKKYDDVKLYNVEII